MARISISIPDKLMQRLEPIKDNINISKLCRGALEQRIAAFERAARREGDVLDLDGLVLRLRQEKDASGVQFEDVGRQNAVAWLNTVSYVEFKNVAEASDSSNMDKYKLPRAAFRGMKQDMAEANAGCEGAPAVTYKTAWLDHVRSVWAQVVDRLEDTNHKEPVAAATESQE